MIFCIVFKKNIRIVSWFEFNINKRKQILIDLLTKIARLLNLLPKYSYSGN